VLKRQVSCGSLLLVLSALASTVSAAPIDNVKNVFIIVFENRNWSSIVGSPSATYINETLLPMASHAAAYYNPPGLHPSLPNYLWMEAGTNFGITDDKDPAVNAQSTTAHLVTQLAASGVPWKSYQEDIPGTNCPLTGVKRYTPRHNPVLYFKDVTDNNNVGSVNCIKHVRPFSELANDLANDTRPQYVFITPNVCNDGHDSCAPLHDPIAQTDTWLKNNLPMLLNSPRYRQAGAIFITWDEAEDGDVPIGMIVLSPFAKGNGYSNTIHYTHGSLLRTVQEIFGVSPLLGDAAKQSSLSDLFQ
jgi:phosphatidylinositol-3-phosphatase